MFSSDVSARGVDYPDVSAVVQVGLTDKEQYIHRLGRTARAGGKGEGILILSDFEQSLLRDLRGTSWFHISVCCARCQFVAEIRQASIVSGIVGVWTCSCLWSKFLQRILW
jgi:superfamily II DNA/RNA helicase